MGLILLRYGELALKGRNRSDFTRQLRRNVRVCLRVNSLQGEVTQIDQRIYVRTEQVAAALEPLSRVFGLTSLSPVAEAPRDIDAIVAAIVEQARLARVGPEVSFRVRARRTDKTFPIISPEINRMGAEAVYRALGCRIDLSDNAAVTVGVEVSTGGALVYGRVVPAPGGLPVGVSGRVVALLSGGIDSPVAAWMLMKRGCSVIPLHFSQNEVETRKALDNIAVLARYSYGWELRPTVLPYDGAVAPVIERVVAAGEARWACVFCKRTMLRRACEVADELGAHAVVLGDSLGQVASQTLANMEVISHGMPKPILRPLIGLDKAEITAIARRIGTFDISTRDQGACGYLPAHPLTVGKLERLLEIERALEDADGDKAD
ncbi:MAG: tRNA 4-thiouridine(8) synthase ThiI [Chloroflexi bacterium]|nr:tRNA 4-thiouridine(8) synthase ThiI [Chloroflexota bacterium]